MKQDHFILKWLLIIVVNHSPTQQRKVCSENGRAEPGSGECLPKTGAVVTGTTGPYGWTFFCLHKPQLFIPMSGFNNPFSVALLIKGKFNSQVKKNNPQFFIPVSDFSNQVGKINSSSLSLCLALSILPRWRCWLKVNLRVR